MRAGLAMRIGCVMTMSIAAGPVAAKDTGPRWTEAAYRSYLQNFRDMALSACIGTAYAGDKTAAADANRTTAAFFEWTRYDVDGATGRLPALIASYLDRVHAVKEPPADPKSGVRLDLMKCIDMYHGPELVALAKAHVDDPDGSFAKDDERLERELRRKPAR